MTEDLGRGGGSGIQGFRPAMIGLSDGQVTGGLAPPGATRAQVRDLGGEWHDAVVANGAWVAVLDEPLTRPRTVVLFRDQQGNIVALPTGGGGRRVPIPDADEACPACDGHEWDRIEEGGGRTQACRRCGHSPPAGGIVFSYSGEPDREPSTDEAERDAELRAEFARRQAEGHALIRRAPFAIYALDGDWDGPQRVTGWGWNVDIGLKGVKIDHRAPGRVEGPAVHVESSIESRWQSDEIEAREQLERVLQEDNGEWPRVSEDALHLRLDARRRERAARSTRAGIRSVEIVVDGQPCPFTLVEEDTSWAAVGQSGDVRIAIASRGVTPDAIVLRTVKDIEPYLVEDPFS